MTDTDQPEPSGRTMLRIDSYSYINSLSAKNLHLHGEPAYEVAEPTDAPPPKVARRRLKAANDTPVFETAEAARDLPSLEPAMPDWTPPRISGPRGVPVFRIGKDGPSEDHRIKAGQAWYASNRYSGQAANDNIDWPLQKLLKAEGNDYLLRLAERYRDMWNAANAPHDLVGHDLADNVYLMTDSRLDESTGAFIDKGVKTVTGKRAQLDVAPKRAVKADPDKTKKRAKPMPRKWQGDLPLLHHIDCGRELAEAQAALGWLRDAFEAAVCHGEKLETIGHEHGVGNKTGAKGAGRALVMLGMQAVDEFWRKPQRRAA